VTKRSTGYRQKKVVTARFARGGERFPRPSPPRPARGKTPSDRADPGVTVRPVTRTDAAAWVRLRAALWPDGTESDHRADVEKFFGGGSRQLAHALIARDPRGDAIGFAELSIRPYAEGCRTDRVAFLEGWYVTPGVRRRGVGRALVQAAERWARAQGCTEFASDREAGNAESAAAHLSLGFEEVGSVVCYRKDL
jgi:aminoglycoside 6'-N-acetyltransferase I